MDRIEIVEVKTRAEVKEFLKLPRSIYSDSSSPYVMPLEIHIKMLMGNVNAPKKHFFLARLNKKTVARLGVKVHEHNRVKRLHFGFYECDPCFPQATKELINAAHALYPDLEMMGPFHFRQEDPYIGILVQGYEHDPFFMMPYNHPSYDKMLQDAGLGKVMDLFTYDLKRSEGVPQLVIDNARRAESELKLTYRTLNPKNLTAEARSIARIFNEALAQNWGFEEFENAQINEMVTLLKLFIDPRVVLFAQVAGRDIGCLLMIPNYNHIIKPSRGRLGFGLLVRYFKRYKTTNSLRGYALGVLKEYQKAGIGSALTAKMFEIGGEVGYHSCEVSWVLANNSPMNDLAVAMGGKQRKVYRIYNKNPLN